MVYSSDNGKTQGAIVIIDRFLSKRGLSEAMDLETPYIQDSMRLIVVFSQQLLGMLTNDFVESKVNENSRFATI